MFSKNNPRSVFLVISILVLILMSAVFVIIIFHPFSEVKDPVEDEKYAGLLVTECVDNFDCGPFAKCENSKCIVPFYWVESPSSCQAILVHGDVCTLALFEPGGWLQNGKCQIVFKKKGTPCDDKSELTIEDKCDHGFCVGKKPEK